MDSGCAYKYIVTRPGAQMFQTQMPQLAQQLQAPPSSMPRGKTICGVLFFILLLFLAWMLLRQCWARPPVIVANSYPYYGDSNKMKDIENSAQQMQFQPGVVQKQQHGPFPPEQQVPTAMKCSATHGARPQGPKVEMPLDGSNYQPRTDWGQLTQTSGKVPGALVNMESTAGSPYEMNSFSPSKATQEYYDAYNPSKLTSMMPASWRGSGDAGTCVEPNSYSDAAPSDVKYSDFGRYAVSPMSAQHAEALRGTIRLSELSSTRNARTLGTSSLLRESVTPVSPIPIGSTEAFSHDSSSRLAMIAAATGSYPDQIGC